LKAPLAAVFQLRNPIGFDAPDQLPVRLLIFLLVPEAATQKHLEILAEIAQLLSDADIRSRLVDCDDSTHLYDLILQWCDAAAVPALAS
jgi:PTS system nitrogen regulatory IIA component